MPAKTKKPAKTPNSKITSHFTQIRKRAMDSPNVSSPLRKVVKTAPSKRFIPAQGSSSFALLVSLLRYELEYACLQVNKLDLQQMASKYNTSSSQAAGGNKWNRFAGWPTIKTLITRELVQKTEGRASYYSLTEEGRKLAKMLVLGSPLLKDFVDNFLEELKAIGESGPLDQLLNKDSSQPHQEEDQLEQDTNIEPTTSTPPSSTFVLTPDDYEIVLCIDSRERIATNFCHQNRAAFALALQRKGVQVDVRTLPLGDFVWVAREKFKPTAGDSQQTVDSQIQRELVLDQIVERKRIDDLASSIKDRRWDEQKYRLRQCGLRRPTYLIEYAGKTSRSQEFGGIRPDALAQAITNASLDGFEVIITESFEETITHLTLMTRALERHYLGASPRSLLSCPDRATLARSSAQDYRYITFNEFSINAGKLTLFTAKEMFIKHLMLFKGLSFEKVAALVAQYPTVSSLLKAYDRLDQKGRMNMLADLKTKTITGGEGRRFGPAISKKICQYYTCS